VHITSPRVCRPAEFTKGSGSEARQERLVSRGSYRGIFVSNICLISIGESVSDGATKISVLKIEMA